MTAAVNLCCVCNCLYNFIYNKTSRIQSHSSSSVNDNKFVFFKVFLLLFFLSKLSSFPVDFDCDDVSSSTLDSVVVFFGFLNNIRPPVFSSSPANNHSITTLTSVGYTLTSVGYTTYIRLIMTF